MQNYHYFCAVKSVGVVIRKPTVIHFKKIKTINNTFDPASPSGNKRERYVRPH